MEVSRSYFFATETAHSDHPMHFFYCIYVFFTVFGCCMWGAWGVGGVSEGIGTQPANAVFHAGPLKNPSFRTLFFSILANQKDHPGYVKHVLSTIYVFFTQCGI